MWLLEAPRPDAPRLAPFGGIVAGVEVDAVEEYDGWVRLDTGDFTGWAPVADVQFER